MSLPEHVARLYESNEEIERTYQLLNSGLALNEILKIKNSKMPTETTNPEEIFEHDSLNTAAPGDAGDRPEISDCAGVTDERVGSHLSQMPVLTGTRPSSRHRVVLVLAITALLVVTAGTSFYAGLHLAKHTPGVSARAEASLTRGLLALDPIPANSSQALAAVPEAPVTASTFISSQPTPVSPGGTPDAAMPAVAAPAAISQPQSNQTVTISAQPTPGSSGDPSDAATPTVAASPAIPQPPADVVSISASVQPVSDRDIPKPAALSVTAPTTPAQPSASTADSTNPTAPTLVVASLAPNPSIKDPASVSSPTKPVPLAAEEVANLLSRGDALLQAGDLASARLFYERAADAEDASATLRLGETYDPAFLIMVGLTGVHGDIAVAKRWYKRALELGAAEAKDLLQRADGN